MTVNGVPHVPITARGALDPFRGRREAAAPDGSDPEDADNSPLRAEIVEAVRPGPPALLRRTPLLPLLPPHSWPADSLPENPNAEGAHQWELSPARRRVLFAAYAQLVNELQEASAPALLLKRLLA